MKQKNKKSGFTLIELVVVIAIIGILAAVITPRIRLALYKARDAKAIAAIDALRTASNVYFAEKGVALGGAGSTMTSAEVDKLFAAGYIDDQTRTKLLKSVSGSGSTAIVLIDAGTVTTDVAPLGCPSGSPNPVVAGKLSVGFTSDGVGLVFNGSQSGAANYGSGITSAIVDTACSPWMDK